MKILPRIKRQKKRSVDVKGIPRLSRSGGLELQARAVIQGIRVGRHRSPWQGSSLEFDQHRSYMPGDEMRHLDWRAYARTDQLLIRRFVDERTLPLTVLIDSSASMNYGQASTGYKYSHAQLATAVLGLLALDQGDTIQVLSTGHNWSKKPRTFSGAQAGRELALEVDHIQRRRLCNWSEVLAAMATYCRRRGLLIIISDFLDQPEELLKPLASLRAHGHDIVLLQILHPDELRLPQGGPYNVYDPEDATSRSFCDAAFMSQAYKEALADHQQSLKHLAHAVRADLQTLTTDKHLAQSLGAWLAMRGRIGRAS